MDAPAPHTPRAAVRVVALVVACAAALVATLAPLASAQATTTTAVGSAVQLAAASDDAAAGTVSWGLAPAAKAPAADVSGGDRANYAYTAKPGQTIRDAVVVTNHSAQALDLRIYAADAFTTSSGQLDLLPAAEASTDLGAWTTLAAKTVHLAPHGHETAAFTVHVPKGAAPGDHSAGIVTSLVQRASDSTVTVDRRLALRMHLRVAGTLAPAMTVSGVSVSAGSSVNPVAAVPVTVRYRITNTGNARVVPAGTVTVEGPFGWTRVAVPDDVPEVLPGSTVVRTVTVTGVRPLGPVHADVVVHAVAVGVGGGASASDDASGRGWAVPWAPLALVLLVVAAAVLGPRLIDRRTKVAGTPASATSEPG